MASLDHLWVIACDARMLELVGWKRLECNKLIRFSGVSDRNFPSIMRRSFVWKAKALFFDEGYLEKKYPDAARDGIFPANAALRSFLRSGPAIAAAMIIQHGFELRHGKKDCEDLIEQWVLEKDGGITEAEMRTACGLEAKPNNRSDNSTPAMALLAQASAVHPIPTQVGTQDRDTHGEPSDPFLQVLDGIISRMLRDNLSTTSPVPFKQVTLPNTLFRADKDEVWRHLVDKHLLIPGKIGDRGKLMFTPFIRTRKALQEVIPLCADLSNLSFQELLDVQALATLTSRTPQREANIQLLLDHLDGIPKSIRKGRRGKLLAREQKQSDDAIQIARKLRASEETAGRLLGKLAGEKQPSGSAMSPARSVRRLSSKTSEERVHASQHGSFVEICVRYKYALGHEFRSRRVAEDIGAQKFPRRLLAVVAHHTLDLDIENCCFVLILQLLTKLELVTCMPEEYMQVIQRCAEDRAGVITDELKTTANHGKHILTSVLNGGAPPAGYEGNAFLMRLSRASKFLRWMACSVAPGVYSLCQADAERTFPEASTFTFVWNAVEDAVLSSWLAFLKSRDLSHISLHYDGVRVAGNLPADIPQFCQAMSDHIFEDVGFRVVIREKKHLYWTDIVRSRGGVPVEVPDVPEVFLRKGNCIPYALWCLGSSTDAVQKKLEDDNQENTRATTRGYRDYASMMDLFDVKCAPSRDRTLTQPGKYLIHSEPRGKPHCTAAVIHEDRQTCTVYLTTGKLSISVDDLQECGNAAIDKVLMCNFVLLDAAALLPHEDKQSLDLLNLMAGADDDECTSEQDSDGSDPSVVADKDETIVSPGDDLLDLLKAEVSRVNRGSLPTKQRSDIRCPLCPFRCFQRWSRWDTHIRVHHTACKQFCCSGTKQLKVIMALFDHDRLRRVTGDNYLARSAELLRTTVRPPLSSNHNEIDRYVRLVFTGEGPKFANLVTVEQNMVVRRVGNAYYTKEFATMLYQEMIVHDSKVSECA